MFLYSQHIPYAAISQLGYPSGFTTGWRGRYSMTAKVMARSFLPLRAFLVFCCLPSLRSPAISQDLSTCQYYFSGYASEYLFQNSSFFFVGWFIPKAQQQRSWRLGGWRRLIREFGWPQTSICEPTVLKFQVVSRLSRIIIHQSKKSFGFGRILYNGTWLNWSTSPTWHFFETKMMEHIRICGHWDFFSICCKISGVTPPWQGANRRPTLLS
jgi:hypothetical protein